MHRVISVNLNDNAYQIDEDGYNALRDYLGRARAGLRSNPDVEEIVTDLERAIAEKCAATLNPNKTVVRASEIAQILSEMGPVAGDTGDGSAAEMPGPQSTDSSQAGPSAPKKLYRIREGKMIGGVCAGLADYVGVDVTMMRLIFVLLTLLTCVWLLVYLIMLLVVPYGPTTRQPLVPSQHATKGPLIVIAALAVLLVLGAFSMGPFFMHGIDSGMGPSMMWPMGMGVLMAAFWIAIVGILAWATVSVVKHLRSTQR